MYRVNYYVLWTLAMMVFKDYGCDDLYGLLLWWSIWIVDVDFYLYVYELLFYVCVNVIKLFDIYHVQWYL